MLDLQSGVHFEEVELAVIVGEELHGARSGVADRAGGQPGRLEQLGPHARDALDQRRRRFFDDLLMAALDRAFPLADRPHRAVRIGHHLDFDVVTGRQVALTEHCGVTERGLRLALGSCDFAWQRVQLVDDPHAASTATRGRLDQHRQLSLRSRLRVEFVEHRNPGRGHHLLGLDLGTHGAHRVDRRADPGQACVGDRSLANSAFSERNP